jgi:hypothetical protein
MSAASYGGCQGERQRREVGLSGCEAVKARVRTPGVVEVEVADAVRCDMGGLLRGLSSVTGSTPFRS